MAITNRTIIGQIESMRKMNGKMWAKSHCRHRSFQLQLRGVVVNGRKRSRKKERRGRLYSFAAVFKSWHMAHTADFDELEKSFRSMAINHSVNNNNNSNQCRWRHSSMRRGRWSSPKKKLLNYVKNRERACACGWPRHSETVLVRHAKRDALAYQMEADSRFRVLVASTATENKRIHFHNTLNNWQKKQTAATQTETQSRFEWNNNSEEAEK